MLVVGVPTVDISTVRQGERISEVHDRESEALCAGMSVACVARMMKTAALAATAVVAMSGPASAGVYLGLGLGPKPMLDDAMDSVGAPSSRSLRGVVGARLANVSLEGAVNGFDLATQRSGGQTVYQASAALKLSIPIVSHIEAFGRGGLERTWLRMGEDPANLRGDGFLAGVGLELRLNLVVASTSIFADYTVHRTSLESTLEKFDSTWQMVGIGVTVGI